MALDDTFTPSIFYFQIQQGAHFHLEFPAFLDATTGLPFDFTSDPEGTWLASMDVILNRETVVAFATMGENGVIALGSDGVVALDLDATHTAALAPTSTEGSVPTGRPLYADLVLTDPSDDQPWVWFAGRGQIRKQVTS